MRRYKELMYFDKKIRIDCVDVRKLTPVQTNLIYYWAEIDCTYEVFKREAEEMILFLSGRRWYQYGGIDDDRFGLARLYFAGYFMQSCVDNKLLWHDNFLRFLREIR